MRESLFRGKSIETEQFIFGDLIRCPVSGKAYIKPCDWEVEESERTHEDGVLTLITYEVYPDTVGQYTGLKDKNGTKIYEGDVVRVESQFRARTHTGVVQYKKAGFVLEGLWMTHYDNPSDFTEELDAVEVIGNIHDNPELLEVTS